MTSRSIQSTSRSEATWLNSPKTYFLGAGIISCLLSIGLWFSGSKEMGLFVGLWVPSICSAGTLVLAGGRRD